MQASRRHECPNFLINLSIVLLGTALLSPKILAQPATSDLPPPVATVNDTAISRADYEEALRARIQNKFYHGKIPEGEIGEVRREVLEDLIKAHLLAAEARRRGIGVDRARIDAQLTSFEERNRGSERWLEVRGEILPRVEGQLEAAELITGLRAQVQAIPKPEEAKVIAYYKLNPDKFTTPEQVKVSAILLGVEPSAGNEAWKAAMEEAGGIIGRIEAGESFAEIARLKSSDASADSGGDMGYIHRGTMAEEVEGDIDNLKVGQVKAYRVLQGVAIIRLEDRRTAQLNEFAKVRERAEGLLVRELKENAWNSLIERLVKGARIERMLVN